jgi:small subunit ribosomal protein S3
VGRVLIERPAKNARITIFSARPGVVIGKKGEDIENPQGRPADALMGVPVHVNIEEIRKPEIDAQLIADSITQQLEKRIMFRRAMKRAMQNAMRAGRPGHQDHELGRLNGVEIARTEWYREGRVPLHTLRADIDYGFSEAKTTYGIIGVKVLGLQGRYPGPQRSDGGRERMPASPSATIVAVDGARPGGRGPASWRRSRSGGRHAQQQDQPGLQRERREVLRVGLPTVSASRCSGLLPTPSRANED